MDDPSQSALVANTSVYGFIQGVLFGDDYNEVPIDLSTPLPHYSLLGSE